MSPRLNLPRFLECWNDRRVLSHSGHECNMGMMPEPEVKPISRLAPI